MDLENIKLRMLNNEKNLTKYASFDSDAIRIKEENKDIRPNYFRDIDRIIHSLSYTRYIDKTQVFSLNSNDHISKRIIHVQLVSKIARTIGRALGLNEDLIEAIALAHDIGHVPFGHVGEKILNDISLKNNQGYFRHNVQSVRTLIDIEKNGQGSNLTLQVLDGILCHNGEMLLNEYYPRKKTLVSFLEEYEDCYIKEEEKLKLIPMTLEGCVVRISDIIGYIGRDIEDAITLNIIDKSKIPSKISQTLGSDNRTIVNTIILDIIKNSYNKPYIKMSKEVFESVLELKKFNYKNIYYKANTDKQLKHYSEMFETLFEYYLDKLNSNEKDSSIFITFLNNMDTEYIKNNSKERIVIDYIAGMTDDYFVNEYNSKFNKVLC